MKQLNLKQYAPMISRAIKTAALLCFTGIFAFPLTGSAQNNPGIIAPQGRYRGRTYGEWGARWWTSMFSYPVVNGQHPYLQGGAFEGHNGVMFLAALPGGVTINVTIPSRTPLLLPVIDVECSVFEPE